MPTADPAVEITLIRAAPMIVPYTPRKDAPRAATAVATALAISCVVLTSGSLRGIACLTPVCRHGHPEIELIGRTRVFLPTT
ncbi:hypothetical protein GCM10023088_39440 [Actinomadura verrucosospora]